MAKINTSLAGTLAILPWRPHYPLRETVGWLTDVGVAWDGTEYADAKRSLPRCSYQISHRLRGAALQDALNTAYGAIREPWAVPLWPEHQFVGNISAGTTSLTCDTDNYPLDEESLALLVNDLQWQIVEIDTVSAGSIGLLSPATAINSAYLIPVRTGFVSGDFQHRSRLHDGYLEATWMLDESPLVTPASYPQFESYDLIMQCPYLKARQLNKSISRRNEIADFEIGVISQDSQWENSRIGTPYSVTSKSHTQHRAHRAFFYRRMGKYRPFWTMLNERNATVINSGTVSTQLDIADNAHTDYAGQRLHLAVRKSDGSWHARLAGSVTQLTATTARYTLTSALNMDAGDIAAVSFLGLNRLDSDQITIDHQRPNRAVFGYAVKEIAP